MMNDSDAYGNYRIRSIAYHDQMLDGIYYNPAGAWLGIVLEERIDEEIAYFWVKPLLEDNRWVAAPRTWRNLVMEYLGPLDV